MFDASIADNFRYGAASSTASAYNNAISDTDIWKAAKAANVHSFIMGLPQGYDTRVGENASLISGGQAQRLQIARALARPWTKIMILDQWRVRLILHATAYRHSMTIDTHKTVLSTYFLAVAKYY